MEFYYEYEKCISAYFIDLVCGEMGIEPGMVTMRTREERVAYARHMIAYLLYNYTFLSLQDVAKLIGRKDHGTIRNSLRVCNKVLDNNKGYKYNAEFVRVLEQLQTMPDILKKQRKKSQEASAHPY